MARGKEEVHPGVDEQGNGCEDSQDHNLKTSSGGKGFIRPERCRQARQPAPPVGLSALEERPAEALTFNAGHGARGAERQWAGPFRTERKIGD
jgi:hypothetical protein